MAWIQIVPRFRGPLIHQRGVIRRCLNRHDHTILSSFDTFVFLLKTMQISCQHHAVIFDMLVSARSREDAEAGGENE